MRLSLALHNAGLSETAVCRWPKVNAAKENLPLPRLSTSENQHTSKLEQFRTRQIRRVLIVNDFLWLKSCKSDPFTIRGMGSDKTAH
jgi:hypothetical protein